MNPRLARQGLAAITVARVAIGITATTWPDAARLAVGGSRLGTRSRMLTRSVAVRDIAIGVATLRALSAPTPEGLALAAFAGAVADAGDAVAALLTAREWPTRRWLPVSAIAAGSACATAFFARAAARD
jgi:hypothetical protein